MITQEFTEQDRRKLLNRRIGALAEYERLMYTVATVLPFSADEATAIRHASAAMARAEAAEAEYYDGLPVVSMSVCPFCSKPLLRSFDRWGFDGPWWRSDASPEDPPTCPHFYALLGAVRLSGTERAARELYPGPDSPFVVPRLLSVPSSVAVVGQLQMENGCSVWPIAYFAECRPRPEDSTAGWKRTSFVYTTQFSISGWRISNEQLDFDLAGWVQRGRVRWCDVASENATLVEGPYKLETPQNPALSAITPSGVVRYTVPHVGPIWPISAS